MKSKIAILVSARVLKRRRSSSSHSSVAKKLSHSEIRSVEGLGAAKGRHRRNRPDVRSVKLRLRRYTTARHLPALVSVLPISIDAVNHDPAKHDHGSQHHEADGRQHIRLPHVGSGDLR